MPRFERENFTNRTIHLDGNAYVDCIFRGCRIVYGGTNPVVLGNNVYDDCTWGFTGPAWSTIEFMTKLHQMGGVAQQLVEATFESIRRGTIHHPPTAAF